MKLLNVLSVEKLNNEILYYLETNKTVIEVSLLDSLDYVLAEDIFAREDTPQFNKSTVDGYAIQFQDSLGASESMPSVLKYVGSVGIGENNTVELESGQCAYVNTGAMLPINANGVVMIEQSEYNEFTDEVLIYKSIAQLENVTVPGSDIEKNKLLFNEGQCIDERVQAVLVAQGIVKVKVYKKLEVIVISSGNELVDYQVELEMGQVRDINIFLISGLLKKAGFKVKQTFLIKDDYNTYLNVLKDNEADIYLSSGGSSQGDEDFTYEVFDEITNNVLCHGLAIKPGKPTILAQKDNKLYLGLPGNPVSAYLVLAQTLIVATKKINNLETTIVSAKLEHNVAGSPGKESVILVNLERIGNEYLAKPLYYRSSNVLTLSKAEGYFVLKNGLEGINEGEEVEVILF